MTTPTPSIEKLKELFFLDIERGWLIRRTRHPGGKNGNIGDRAGHTTRRGYRVISIGDTIYLEHRVVLAMVSGNWPDKKLQVDHINGIRSDNRPSNLRLATNGQNKQNSSVPRNSISGLKGVSKQVRGGRYRMHLQANGKLYVAHGFDTADLAKEFRDLMADMLHGEFARS